MRATGPERRGLNDGSDMRHRAAPRARWNPQPRAKASPSNNAIESAAGGRAATAALAVLLVALSPAMGAAPATRPAPPTTLPDVSAAPDAAPDAASGELGGLDSPELLLFSDIPVVVAAGKRAQAEDQVAASVSVVTADDIELFG